MGELTDAEIAVAAFPPDREEYVEQVLVLPAETWLGLSPSQQADVIEWLMERLCITAIREGVSLTGAVFVGKGG